MKPGNEGVPILLDQVLGFLQDLEMPWPKHLLLELGNLGTLQNTDPPLAWAGWAWPVWSAPSTLLSQHARLHKR